MSKPRARELGIPFEGEPGALNAITDIQGIEVGYATLIEGQAIRTGVTIIHPRGKNDHDPVYAGHHAFNGNGEMTGSAWVEEEDCWKGQSGSPIPIPLELYAIPSSTGRSKRTPSFKNGPALL